MGLWDRFEKKRARQRVADEDARLKLARNTLARAFDEEAERLNGGKMIEYGSTRAQVIPAAREAKDLASFVRKLAPRDPRVQEIRSLEQAGLLAPLDESARAVLDEAWPGGFDADAKLAAAMKALRESRASKEKPPSE
ncbi:MAG: hypothetical protein WBQ14_03265 [Gaiellaceae bacterium]